MRNVIHFISGMPRAGSTLLAAILRQNPRFRAGIISPTGSLVSAVLRDLSQNNETSLFVDDRQREAILRGVFANYYHDLEPGQVVFDNNRAWCAKLDLLSALFPTAKIICCVRHLPLVLDSIERLIRKNLFQPSRIFDFDADGTVYTRVDGLVGRTGMVGFAYNALKQAMHSTASDRLMLVSYETLTRQPAEAMAAIYDFAGLEPFSHDFDNVVFDATEFDARLGTPGLHDVRPQVRPNQRQSILPPDLWRRFENEDFWREPTFNLRNVPII